jgi:two-component system, OmpR family, response regulator
MVEFRQSLSGLKLSTVYRKPMNVGLVAKVCQVSKKTVLNWIYRGALKAFTTYGGHYRIWPGDLNEFIEKAGIDVPFNHVDDRYTTFLIVDNDPQIAHSLKESICAGCPYANVIISNDGYEALLLIGERRPHVVIFNLKMPNIDSFQVFELLKKRKKDNAMKIVVLTGYQDDAMREKLMTIGADEIWERNRPLNEFCDVLKGLLNGTGNHSTVAQSL